MSEGSPTSGRDAQPSIGAILPAVYQQLRIIARARMARERAGGRAHTLQPTALVHEALARLAHAPPPSISPDQGDASPPARAEFFIAAAREMERILIDHARMKFAQKRGGDPASGGRVRVPIDVVDLAAIEDSQTALALHEAILRLEKEDPQAAAVVRLRFFGGLSNPEAAGALGISERTVVREWTFARAFLAAELGGDPEDQTPRRHDADSQALP